MKKRTFWNVVWGLLFIAAAGLVALHLFGLLGQFSIWSLIVSILFAAGAISCAVQKSWWGMFGLLAVLALINREFVEQTLDITLNIWALIGIAVFLSIGFQLLFGGPKKSWKHDRDHHISTGTGYDGASVENATGEKLYFSERFTGASKYINSENLSQVVIENSFGGMEVYFDNATLAPEGATVDIDNKFGGLELYFPREWNVINNISNTFGDTSGGVKNIVEGAPTVTLRGECKFGGVEIKLV